MFITLSSAFDKTLVGSFFGGTVIPAPNGRAIIPHSECVPDRVIRLEARSCLQTWPRFQRDLGAQMSKGLFHLAEGCLLDGAKTPVTTSLLNRTLKHKWTLSLKTLA